MKAVATAFAALLALAASGFDSEEWLGKREVLSREAERLQAAFADCAAQADAPAENIALPIESHPDGSVKAAVSAKQAQFFLDRGLVWGTGVVLRQFATNGVVEAEVAAENCVVDRTTKSGWAPGRARARYQKTELEGDGIYFSFSEEFVKISSNVEIRVKDQKFDTKQFQQLSGEARDAKVVADRADYDRKAGVALFEGGVKVSDGETTLGAERLFIFLDGTNSLKRLVADGGVTVTNGVRSGSCARATYVKAAGCVTMYGDGAGRPARLAEESQRRNEIEGRKIVFWLDSEQVEVEGAAISVDGGMLGGRGGALELMGK